MTRKLYGDILSPGVRAVLLTAKALQVDVVIIPIDIHKKEHLTPEFIKINPQCTIPTLDDNGFIIWESHSIMVYLASKYGQQCSIYPMEVQKQAHINRILHFDTGELFPTYSKIAQSILTKETNEIPTELSENMKKAYSLIELFLKDYKYIADDHVTLADFSIWTTITNSSAVAPIEENKYPRITAWLKNLENLPYQELNSKGGNMAKNVLSNLLNK